MTLDVDDACCRRSAYVLVLDAETANVHLAANFLCVFITALVEHFGNFNIFSSAVQVCFTYLFRGHFGNARGACSCCYQFYHRPEDVFVLLDKFLPNGQLRYTH